MVTETLTGNETGLVTLYNFNQGISGGNNVGLMTLVDSGTNGLNGTLNNFTLNGNSSNWHLDPCLATSIQPNEKLSEAINNIYPILPQVN